MTLVFSSTVILSVGLMVGVEFAVSAFINPVIWKLDPVPRRQAVRLFALKLGRAMPWWYAANLLLLVIQTVALRQRAAIPLLVSACTLWAAVIILTIAFLVPINNRLARDASMPLEEAHRQHRRWDAMHRARIAALAVAFLLLLFGVHP